MDVLPPFTPLNFDFYDGGATPVEVGHDTTWRTLPYHVLVNNHCAQTRVEQRDRAQYVVHAGESFLIRRGISHRLRVVGGEAPVSVWCHFTLTLFHHLDLLDFFEVPPRFPAAAGGELIALCRELVTAPVTNGAISILLKRNADGLRLAETLLRHCSPRPALEERVSLARRLTPALDYMRNHACGRLTLSEVAHQVNLSESRFTALFRQAMKCSALAYHRRMRMLRAHDLLLKGEGNLDELAEQLGFYDAFHFSKQFKTYFGMSPGEYWKQNRDRQRPRF